MNLGRIGNLDSFPYQVTAYGISTAYAVDQMECDNRGEGKEFKLSTLPFPQKTEASRTYDDQIHRNVAISKLNQFDSSLSKAVHLKKSWTNRFGNEDMASGHITMMTSASDVPILSSSEKLSFSAEAIMQSDSSVTGFNLDNSVVDMEVVNDSAQSNSNISCLFPEILSLIFQYLDVQSKGRVARVSKLWNEAAYRHHVWRGVESRLHLKRPRHSVLQSLVRRGIKRVQVLSLHRGIRDLVIGMPEMCGLSLSGCYNVTDTLITTALTHDLPCLTKLDISLCKQISDISLLKISKHLKNLEELDLSSCSSITDCGVLFISGGLKNLRVLSLRSCWKISDQGIAYLAGIEDSFRSRLWSIRNELEEIRVKYGVQVEEFDEMKLGLPMLETLVLQDCQKLSEVALKYVSIGLTKLQCLNLNFCASVTDAGLRFLAQRSSLRSLCLRSCSNISDTGIRFLSVPSSSSNHLTSLDVSFCERIGNQSLVYVAAGMPYLEELGICSCAITDEGLERLTLALPELRALRIGQCNLITDQGVELIADRLRNLESIDLYGCTGTTSASLEKIMKLPKLSMLNLSIWHRS